MQAVLVQVERIAGVHAEGRICVRPAFKVDADVELASREDPGALGNGADDLQPGGEVSHEA